MDSEFFHDTLLDRPHKWGDGIIAALLGNNHLEFHLY
jgi:hypothetical protein